MEKPMDRAELAHQKKWIKITTTLIALIMSALLTVGFIIFHFGIKI